ncbi:MAG: CPBP family intramembrane metalloprotease [Candidatus Eremiobacteraeota bacterium]|nr:CPBP family intramembrane metalloprotease [Candidatus Eremiobacteraeota bacterium]
MKRSAAVYAIVGLALAIGITMTMDATGLTTFSALPLLALGLVLWALTRISRAKLGLTLGRPSDYVWAIAYPVAVLALVVLVAVIGGATHASPVTSRVVTRVAIAAVAGILAALLTEEGFFRGWLWASLDSAGLSRSRILILTSIAFAAWHISYATLAHGYTLPAAQVVVYIANAAVIGVIWGMMRSISGSIIVSSVSHSLWNAVAYELFGEGPKIGLLGITQTSIFGAEVGIVGLLLNCLFAAAIFIVYRRRAADESA